MRRRNDNLKIEYNAKNLALHQEKCKFRNDHILLLGGISSITLNLDE